MPTNPKNKIKYGIKNVYYAVATIAADDTATYGMPVALPGAVSLSLEPQGEASPFYADDIVYYTSYSNNGYEGDLELAIIPDSFKTDVLGYILHSDGVLYENVDAETVHFALLFEFSGDKHHTRHVMYNCVSGRPATGSTTKGESIEPQTESLTITSTSIYNATLAKHIAKASTNADTTSSVYEGWFSAVNQPTT